MNSLPELMGAIATRCHRPFAQYLIPIVGKDGRRLERPLPGRVSPAGLLMGLSKRWSLYEVSINGELFFVASFARPPQGNSAEALPLGQLQALLTAPGECFCASCRKAAGEVALAAGRDLLRKEQEEREAAQLAAKREKPPATQAPERAHASKEQLTRADGVWFERFCIGCAALFGSGAVFGEVFGLAGALMVAVLGALSLATLAKWASRSAKR